MRPEGIGGRLVGPALIGLVGLATALALALIGDPLGALAPTVVLSLLWVVSVVPLRTSVSALLFALLATPVSADGGHSWVNPLSKFGDLLQINLDMVYPATHVKFSGVEMCAVLLLAVAVYRRTTRNPVDAEGRVPTAGLITDLGIVYFVAVAFAAGNGLARGGSTEVVIWQVRPMLHYLLFLALFLAAYRGPRDHALMAKVVVAAAAVRAVTALVLYFTIAKAQNLDYVLSHGDSVLLIAATVLLMVVVLEKAGDRRTRKQALLLIPLLLAGVWANNRRLAWVELAFALIALLLVTPLTRQKRHIIWGAVLVMPVLIAYLALGWNSGRSIFAPVQMIRSVSDTTLNRSAWDREVEDWNLMVSMGAHPLSGRGFGFEYTEYIVGDDLTPVFPMYRAVPHNSVLGLLLFAGAVPFACIWYLFLAGIFLAMRSYRRTIDRGHRAAALASVGGIVVFWLQAWGDLGLSTIQAQLVAGLALAVAGRLAVVVEAWPTPRERFSTAPERLRWPSGMGGGDRA